MSSFKRFVDIARAEVGALREKVSERVTGTRKLEEFSDDELVAEIEKRRLQKQLREEADAKGAADAARKGKEAPPAPGPAAAPSPASRSRGARAVAMPASVEKYYANLEVEPGADLETVKRAYRRLMRKYHPDKHAGDAEKHKAATELAQSLTRAYMELKKHLEGSGR